MTTSTTVIVTANASRYLQQLCKHFAHKVPTTFDPSTGRIDFPMGAVDLAADGDKLTLTVTPSEAEKLAELQDVVARHLVRFAFREELAFDWQPARAIA